MRENPIPVAREKSISHSSTSSNEENLLSSGSKSSAAANLVDPYALISKTSASEFRKNNDSISSNTTNEDIDEDEDYNYCDSNEQQVRKTLQIFTEIIQGHLKQMDGIAVNGPDIRKDGLKPCSKAYLPAFFQFSKFAI